MSETEKFGLSMADWCTPTSKVSRCCHRTILHGKQGGVDMYFCSWCGNLKKSTEDMNNNDLNQEA